MSKNSKKGFRKLESHEMANFTSLQGEESGSDSEMIELEREHHPRTGGSMCCWCAVLYLLLLSCVVVLMGMVAVYFGYNMMDLSDRYDRSLASLEDRVTQLETSLNSAEDKCRDKMAQLRQQLVQVNASVSGLGLKTSSQVLAINGSLGSVQVSVSELTNKMSNLVSHPPNGIGEDEVQEILTNVAGFKGHLESYDSQLSEVKRNVGDTRQEMTQVREMTQLLQRNVSELKRSLDTLQQNSKDMAGNLDLLSDKVTALQSVTREMNSTLAGERTSISEHFNVTNKSFHQIQDQLSVVATQLSELSIQFNQLNATSLETTMEPALTDMPISDSTPTESPTAEQMPTSEHTQPTTITQSTTGPVESTTEPTTVPTTEPTELTTGPTTVPTTEPTELTTESTTVPTTQPTELTTELTTVPTTQPTELTTEPTTVPTTQPTELTTEPTTTPTIEESEPTELTPESTSETDPIHSINPQPTTPISEDTTTSEDTETSSTDTTPSGQSLRLGTQAGTDSTGETGDFPASIGDSDNDSDSDSAGNGDANKESYPFEAQPPTVSSTTKIQHSMEQLQELLNQFGGLDGNSDGGLDLHEFSDFTGDAQYTSYVFDHLDVNKNGFITEGEILTAIQNFDQKIKAELPESDIMPPDDISVTPPIADSQSPEDTLRGILNFFGSLDLDFSDDLSQDELSNYFLTTNEHLESVFSYLDQDGDNRLTREEIIHGLNLLEQTQPSTESSPEPFSQSSDPMEDKNLQNMLAGYLNGNY